MGVLSSAMVTLPYGCPRGRGLLFRTERAHHDRAISRNQSVAAESGVVDTVGALFQSHDRRVEQIVHLHGVYADETCSGLLAKYSEMR
jgi:hypothetical protein